MSEAIEGDFIPDEQDTEEQDQFPMDAMDSQDLLNFSQQMRRRLVNDMTRKGMPEDKDERGTLLQTLRDMDSTSIHRLKLDVDQQSVDNDRQAQDIVRRLTQERPRGLVADPQHQRNDIPEPSPDELPEAEYVKGETSIGLEQEDSKTFLNRMEGDDKA